MIPQTAFLNEFDPEDMEESFRTNDFFIYRYKHGRLKNYYIYYPAVDRQVYLGPFFTRNGSIKYAFNLKADVDFGDFN